MPTPTFAIPCELLAPDGTLHRFAPGDALPAWATDDPGPAVAATARVAHEASHAGLLSRQRAPEGEAEHAALFEAHRRRAAAAQG